MLFKLLLVSFIISSVVAQDTSVGAGCTVTVSIARRTSAGNWTDSQGRTNIIFDISLVNNGNCPAVDVGVSISLPANSEIVNSWNIQASPVSSLIVGFGSQLAVGATVSNIAGFVLAYSTSSTSADATLTVYGVNCPTSCIQGSSSTGSGSASSTGSSPTSTTGSAPSSTTGSAPSSTTGSSPSATTSSSSSTTTGSPSSLCQNADVYYAIVYSATNGTYGIASDSGGASAAVAYATQDCTVYGSRHIVGCEPIMIIQNQCVALALSGNTPSVGAGATQAAAEATALANCNCLTSGLNQPACAIVHSIC